jgi:hypothetical protein
MVAHSTTNAACERVRSGSLQLGFPTPPKVGKSRLTKATVEWNKMKCLVQLVLPRPDWYGGSAPQNTRKDPNSLEP